MLSMIDVSKNARPDGGVFRVLVSITNEKNQIKIKGDSTDDSTIFYYYYFAHQ